MMPEADRASILIVDDLPEKLLVYQTILEDLGQNLVLARSGEEALRQVLRHEFAVILLDVNMPGMDGFETATLIRKRKKSAHTPIIFVTGFADEMRTIEGYAHGAVDYILTPVVPEILRAKVNVFVNLFRMSQQIKRQAEERLALAEERTRRTAAEDSNRRLDFLAKAGAVLGRSLDYDATLHDIVRLAVPFLADWCAIALPTNQGDWRVVEARRTEQGTETSEHAEGLAVVPGDLAAAIERSYQVVDAEFVPEAEGNSADARYRAVVQPLVARGDILAVLALAIRDSDRAFAPAEITVAEALASRAAIALDNARLYGDIQRADRQKNEFLSMLAHELRNPLAPIRTGVEVLRLLGSSEEPQLRSTCDIIDRQVGHLVRLVDDLLDVSRITRGKIRLQREEVEARAIIASAIEISRPLIEERKQLFSVSMPAEPVWLHADPIRMAQVLSNLLNNAAKYTEEAGHISLSLEQQGPQATFRVRDSGTGISPEMLSKIFELFTQADRSLDRSQGGLGIGLTLVRHLVEMHGGTVEASSEGIGKGSEFIIRLPALSRKPSAASPTPSENGGEGRTHQGTSVLIVDDNLDAARSLAILMRSHGHEVHIAHDGKIALDEARRLQPQVVLLDIGLPGMDGYEIARILRSDAGFARALLLAVTGYGQEEDRRKALDAGFDHHLIKPVDHGELNRLIELYRAGVAAVSAGGETPAVTNALSAE